MSDWKWWAGGSEEIYTVGPCDTREEAIECAKFEIGEDGFYILEACQDPMQIADFIPEADTILEWTEDHYQDSGLSGEDEVGFDVPDDLVLDLDRRIKAAAQEWQEAHNLVFKPWSFTAQRNAEYIEPTTGTEE